MPSASTRPSRTRRKAIPVEASRRRSDAFSPAQRASGIDRRLLFASIGAVFFRDARQVQREASTGGTSFPSAYRRHSTQSVVFLTREFPGSPCTCFRPSWATSLFCRCLCACITWVDGVKLGLGFALQSCRVKINWIASNAPHVK
jgi:hypothetical protein